MSNWKKCSDEKGQTVWINHDNVTNITGHDIPKPYTEIVFVGGGQIFARERPEDLIPLPQSK